MIVQLAKKQPWSNTDFPGMMFLVHLLFLQLTITIVVVLTSHGCSGFPHSTDASGIVTGAVPSAGAAPADGAKKKNRL